MKNIIIILLIICCKTTHGISKKSNEPKTAKFGIYITDIYDIKFDERSFNLNFWIWLIHDGTLGDLDKKIDFVNAKEKSYEYSETVKVKENYHISTAKIKAKVIKTWDMKNFPFDIHYLPIVLEGTGSHNINKLLYTPDKEGSFFNKKTVLPNLPGWKSVEMEIKTEKYPYQSTFGFPKGDAGASTYPRFLSTIKLKRDWKSEFLKCFGILYLAFIFSLISFFLKKGDLEDRVNINLSAIATVIVNKIIMQSYLPPSEGITLYLKIEYLTLFIILLIFLSTIFYTSMREHYPSLGRRIQWSIFFLFSFIYIYFNLSWLINAHHKYSTDCSEHQYEWAGAIYSNAIL